MANYTLNKTVYNRGEYQQIVDTSFTQFKVQPPEEDTITVEQFFDYYTKIFYDIPPQGDINSHAYLVKVSGEYIKSSNINEDVQLLLDEISSLRQQLLDSQQQLVNIQISSSMQNV
jgi:hypothetical protein